MSPVAAPADKRFRRAHVRPSRRRDDWRRFVVPLARYAVVTIVLAGIGWVGWQAVARASVLKIGRLVVRGNDHLSRGEVLAVLGGLRGRSLIWTDLEPWRQRLLASAWVRDAAFRRSLPATVEVVVSERQPVGIARLGGDLYLVDEQGTLIDQYGPHYAELDLPIVDGLAAPGQSAGGTTDANRAELAAHVIDALRGRPDVARRLSQVDVSDAHDAAIILEGDPAVIHLGDERFLPRLDSYLELASALRERVHAIDYVDLRFDHRIYVRPAPAARRGEPGGQARRGRHSGGDGRP